MERTGSTNDDLLELAASGAPEGTVLVAGEQTRGRGRQGRRWEARPGQALLMSVLLRPPGIAPHRISAALTLACAECLGELASGGVGIKWPNDLEAGGRKLGGVLPEVRSWGTESAHLVWGLGLNVTSAPRLEDGREVVSLAELASAAITPALVLERLLPALQSAYQALPASWPLVVAGWRGRCTSIGREVAVEQGGRRWSGVAEGLDGEGCLLLRHGGMVETLWAGELHHLRDAPA